jgi:hypothetical protein
MQYRIPFKIKTIYQPEENSLKSPIIEHLKVNIRTSYIRRIGITYKFFLKMPLPLNFYPSYSKGIIKDARFYYNYNIRFNISSPFTFRLEVPVAVHSTRPINNTSANSNNMPTALKSINLTIAATKIVKEQNIKAAKAALFSSFRLGNKHLKPAPSFITFNREIEV